MDKDSDEDWWESSSYAAGIVHIDSVRARTTIATRHVTKVTLKKDDLRRVHVRWDSGEVEIFTFTKNEYAEEFRADLVKAMGMPR